ncbi:hypothetical protein LV28_22830 [Pandoraea pnomenusa]|nr:hypothetical protein LV28_22830 [Pandoraea pnomenusa]
MTCCARLLDLYVPATFKAIFKPNQVQIILAFGARTCVTRMLVKVIEQLVEYYDCLVVEAADCNPSAGHFSPWH